MIIFASDHNVRRMIEKDDTNITPRQKAFLVALKASANNVSKACQKCKISRATFYVWCDTNKDFKNEVDYLKESVIDLAEEELMKKIKKGDTTALIFFLKTQGKSRGYIEREEQVNVNGFEQLMKRLPKYNKKGGK